jgi:hypothetical protein
MITAVYAIIFSMDDYLKIAISSLCACISLVFATRSVVKDMKIHLTAESIVLVYPFGIQKTLYYRDVHKIALANKGVSLFALARTKVLIVWKKEEHVNAFNILLSIANADEFVEAAKQYL